MSVETEPKARSQKRRKNKCMKQWDSVMEGYLASGEARGLSEESQRSNRREVGTIRLLAEATTSQATIGGSTRTVADPISAKPNEIPGESNGSGSGQQIAMFWRVFGA